MYWAITRQIHCSLFFLLLCIFNYLNQTNKYINIDIDRAGHQQATTTTYGFALNKLNVYIALSLRNESRMKHTQSTAQLKLPQIVEDHNRNYVFLLYLFIIYYLFRLYVLPHNGNARRINFYLQITFSRILIFSNCKKHWNIDCKKICCINCIYLYIFFNSKRK